MGSSQSTSLATSSASCAARSGKYKDSTGLTAVSNETATVLDIGHYRVCIKNGNSIVLHDFVGLRVRIGGGSSIYDIRAEKDEAGISVTRPIDRWDTDDIQMKHRAEELEDCGDIRVEDLLAIFEEPSPDYSLTSDNCWKYADATFKHVIRKFLEKPSLTPDRRSYLANFLNNPPPVMPVNVIISCSLRIIQVLIGLPWLIGLEEEALLFSSIYPTAAIWFGPWPFYIFVGFVFFCVVYEVVTFAMDGTSPGQAIMEFMRSFRFRRPSLRSLRFRRPLQQQAHGLPSM